MSGQARSRIAVLASGGGSNLGALLDHLDTLGDARRADVIVVGSDRTAAGALERARARGIEAVRIQTTTAADAEPVDELLRRVDADLVVLAGYLRLVPEGIVRAYHGRMLNVHPALLPAFGGAGMYGRRVHEAVIASGARISGPTVHFADEVFDHGAIIAQWPVPVLPGDSAESLATRVLRAEHALYPRIVHAVASGDVVLGADHRAAWTRPATDDSLRFALASATVADPLALDTLYPNH